MNFLSMYQKWPLCFAIMVIDVVADSNISKCWWRKTMLCYKAYKFRIYPNKEQKVLFAKTFGCVRLVYNYYLNRKIKAYEIDKSTLSYRDCSKDLVPLKKEKDFLKEVDSISLQQSLRHQLINILSLYYMSTKSKSIK